MLRYVLYARKSDEREDRQVQSIEDQLRVLHSFALERDCRIVREYIETKSAKAEGIRPVFLEMLGMLRRGEADAILCWNLNRLSRNPEDSGRLAGMLQRDEIKAIQSYDRLYLPGDNALIMAVDAGMANQFIIELRRNTMRGMAAKVSKGHFPHRAPEGYVNDKHKDQGERTISPDPERFDLIRKAHEMMLTGSYSVIQVHRTMNEEWGYRTKVRKKTGGTAIPLSTLYGIFSNIFYAGYFVEGRVIHKGAHEPMIALEQFNRIQSIIKRERPEREVRHYFPYTGLITCAHCGGYVTAEVKRKPSGRVYRYYHCRGVPCKRYLVRQEVLDKEIADALKKITIDPEIGILVKAAIIEWKKGQMDQTLAVYETRQKSQLDVERRLDALVDMKLENLLTNEQFREKQQVLEAELNRLKVGVTNAQYTTADIRETTFNTVEFHLHAAELFQNADPVLKKTIARSLGATFVLEPHR